MLPLQEESSPRLKSRLSKGLNNDLDIKGSNKNQSQNQKPRKQKNQKLHDEDEERRFNTST